MNRYVNTPALNTREIEAELAGRGRLRWGRKQESASWTDWLLFSGLLLGVTFGGARLAGMLRADLGFVAAVVIPAVGAGLLWNRSMRSLSRVRQVTAQFGLAGVLLGAAGLIAVFERIDRVGPYIGGSLFGWTFLVGVLSGGLLLAGRGATRAFGLFAAGLLTTFSMAAMVAI
jgi:hypothetical protein